MYTDEGLDNAVVEGVFTEASIVQFREWIAAQKNTQAVDEENFRLVTRFNDFFVVIPTTIRKYVPNIHSGDNAR